MIGNAVMSYSLNWYSSHIPMSAYENKNLHSTTFASLLSPSTGSINLYILLPSIFSFYTSYLNLSENVTTFPIPYPFYLLNYKCNILSLHFNYLLFMLCLDFPVACAAHFFRLIIILGYVWTLIYLCVYYKLLFCASCIRQVMFLKFVASKFRIWTIYK